LKEAASRLATTTREMGRELRQAERLISDAQAILEEVKGAFPEGGREDRLLASILRHLREARIVLSALALRHETEASDR